MSRDAVLSDPAIFRPSDGDVSSSTGTVVYWIAVPLFGTYYSPENRAVNINVKTMTATATAAESIHAIKHEQQNKMTGRSSHAAPAHAFCQ